MCATQSPESSCPYCRAAFAKCEAEQCSSQLDGPLSKHLRFSLLRAETEQVEYRWKLLCKLGEKIRRDDRKVRCLPTRHALKRHAEILWRHFPAMPGGHRPVKVCAAATCFSAHVGNCAREHTVRPVLQ